MILLLGANGYMGHAFAAEIFRRGYSFIPLTRSDIDYSDFDVLFDYVRNHRPEFIINAAGYSPHPDVDACELEREAVLCGNVILPQTISRVCLMTNTPWGHVSSGSIYRGAKAITDSGHVTIEPDLNRPKIQRLFEAAPERIRGFNERDEPNFTFHHAPCNFYSGSKALAEETIRDAGQCYLWRPRHLFNELDAPRNLLSKLLRHDRIYDGINSLTHLDDFVSACLELWEWQAPFGIYNVVNPGAITNRRLIALIRQFLNPDRDFNFWKSDTEFYRHTNRVPRANCILDPAKLLAAGVKMRSVEEALKHALQHWQPGESEFADDGFLYALNPLSDSAKVASRMHD